MAMSETTPPPGDTHMVDVLDATRLDGHTVDELNDYLDDDRTPVNPSIEASAGCQLALEALDRLRHRTLQLLENQAQNLPEPPDGWIRGIMERIAIEAHAGRNIPIVHPAATGSLILTEGAVRGMIRTAGDSIDEVIVGRCHLDGDITVPGEPITVQVDITVGWGQNLPHAADHARAAIYRRLHAHTELIVTAIDVTVRDVRYSIAPPANQPQAQQ